MVIILESFLLPFTEEDRVCTSQGTISAYVMYYSKFDQEVNALIDFKSGGLQELKNKGKVQSVQKLVVAVAYRSSPLQELLIIEFTV